MISHSHKFIFIHAPKTAGNSIQNILMQYSIDTVSISPEWVPQKEGDTIERFGTSNEFGLKHATLADYYNQWAPNRYGEISHYFKFGVARNPWDRVISHYFRHGGDSRAFEEQHFVDYLGRADRPWAGWPRGGPPVPLWEYFSSPASEALAPALDYIIKFEELQEGFNYVCKRIKIPLCRVPHANASPHQPYWTYYSEQTRDLVATIYQQDIQYFGYKFRENTQRATMEALRGSD